MKITFIQRVLLQLILSFFTLYFSSCAGTHGQMKSYHCECSKMEFLNELRLLDSIDETIRVKDNADPSTINRPGYYNIYYTVNGNKKIYKIHFRMDMEDSTENAFSFGLISIIGGGTDEEKNIHEFQDKVISKFKNCEISYVK